MAPPLQVDSAHLSGMMPEMIHNLNRVGRCMLLSGTVSVHSRGEDEQRSQRNFLSR